MMLLLLLHLIFIRTSHNLLQSIRENHEEKYLKSYFQCDHFLHKTYTFCTYINVNLPKARNIADWILKKNACPYFIATKFLYNPKYAVYAVSQVNFVFVEDIYSIEKVITKTQLYAFWKTEAETHFIICSSVESLTIMPEILDKIWKKNMLNFVVVLVSQKLEVFGYNPFLTTSVLNYTNSNDLFPDKTRNLYGYQLKVIFFYFNVSTDFL